MRKILLCSAGVAAAALSPLFVLAAAGAPAPGEPALVITLPWHPPASEALQRSGLREIAPFPAPFGALTVLNGAKDAEVLKRSGIWLVLDGRKVSELCGL